ncbi:MAG: hypothetical protein H7235_06185, partial [Bdellovibrionaceae bacterium]|nr:hypothetical protein [Pseudobdellovibrionaceae bacterium]
GSASYIFNAEVSWTNGNTRNSKNKGIGIRFFNKQTTLREVLQKWLYGKNNSVGYDGAKSDFSSPISQIKALINYSF